MKISYALAALVAMLCLAGVVSAQQSVNVGGTVGTAFVLNPVTPGTFSGLGQGDNVATQGTISVNTNAVWWYQVSGAPMSGSSGTLDPMGIQPTGGSVISIPTTGPTGWIGSYSLGNPDDEHFNLHQSVGITNLPGTYSTTLTFTVSN